MDIMETIRARYSEISSVQKRIADYCLEHPDAASFQTLREFAQDNAHNRCDRSEVL